MNEPNYEYVKGKGWIVQNLESLDFEDRNGKQWTLVARKPAIGEFGNYCNITNQFYAKDGKAYLQGWANYFQYGPEDRLVSQDTHNKAYESEISRGWTCILGCRTSSIDISNLALFDQ